MRRLSTHQESVVKALYNFGKMQGDDPPYLSVGTAVSAKYKGAFCEAKVSKVVRIVKCKVTYKQGLGTATVNDEQIKGTLRVGQIVQAKHTERKDFVEATITKIQDCSQYTVVFDDGDITTLRRTALCLKSGRHFNESETLDQLPLTHPEHFGNPVMGGRRGRRSRQLKEDSSEGEGEEENEPDLELYTADAGRVVSVEASDKKRNKDNWFPGLIVMPSAQPTVRINVKDEFLVRSFKDGRYYTVPKKEVSEFKREMGSRIESSTLAEAVDKALKFLDQDELPVHWERNSLFNLQSNFSDSDENITDSSDDEPTEEKDHFVAQLYKFMDDSGTPLNKTPTIGSKDVDLYRLFRLVQKMGGYNRVTNQNKWKSITARLKFTQNQSTYNQVKSVYKKCLLSYESFYRTLGCTMLNHTRNSKKNKGRALIRDKDRVTPVQSPRPDKEEEPEVKKEEEEKPKVIKKPIEKKVEEKKKEPVIESSDNSNDAMDPAEIPSTSKDVGRPKRADKVVKEKKVKAATGDKVKALVEKFEEQAKKVEKEDDRVQQTRSKSQGPRSKDVVSPDRRHRETKTPMRDIQTKVVNKPIPKKIVDDEKEKDKKRGRKRINIEDKTSNSDSSVNEPSTSTVSVITTPSQTSVNIGDKLKVYYGPTHESKVTYEAKVIEIDRDSTGMAGYLVHYTGWNTRYDEWIVFSRIAENLSATTKAKRLKQGLAGKSSNKPAAKRGRGMSITGRSTVSEAPRSTTPSSVTSSSSRTKSPATPASRSGSRVTTRQGETSRRTRRTSAQTDISIHSESESDERSESDTELSRTRSGNKSDEVVEPRTYRRKLIKTKGDKRKEDDDTEKEEEIERPLPKRARKLKKLSDMKMMEDSDDDMSNQPKGKEFDLNQIRSELKGFTKAIKVASTDTSEKETLSSDESTTLPDVKDVETDPEDKKDKTVEKSSSSEDIYEFKEPEPFEFEARKIEDKSKKRIPRLFEEVESRVDKSPKKKSPKSSPIKTEDGEKKRFRRTPIKKIEEIETDEKTDIKEEKKSDDPFDKLVESPSFHIGKSTIMEKPADKPMVVKVLNMDEPLSMFELPESMEENSEDRLELSDNEEQQSAVTFTHASPLFLHSNFDKQSPVHILDDSFSVKAGNAKKDSEEDDEDPIQASIQRVIAQTALTDDDSNDTLLQNAPSLKSEPALSEVKSPPKVIPPNRLDNKNDIKGDIVEEVKEIKPIPPQISSVFQETDSSFLANLCATPQYTTKVEEINVKTGTKIADTILQKFELIKSMDKSSGEETEEEAKLEIKKEDKIDQKIETVEEKPMPVEIIPSPVIDKVETSVVIPMEIKHKIDDEIKDDIKEEPIEISIPEIPEFKKRSNRKFMSKEFIDDTDSESDSDSEQRLVIARSDEDSQTSTSFDNKVDIKESDSNISNLIPTEDSQSQEEERNFKFDQDSQIEEEVKEDIKIEDLEVKEEEPDSHLHSMLLCEETIPGSPAPAPQNEPKLKNKNVLETPFASAPSCSNSKAGNTLENVCEKQPSPVPLVLPLDIRENRDVSTVLDNTPPTTPESTISNLSPRGETGGLSPNTADNESCKSIEAENDYQSRRSVCNKVSTYSEDDSLMNSEPQTSTKKIREDLPSPCKKRRRSCKGENENVPTKRGRKSNRSRHNSDSDDTSEHSLQGMQGISANIETRLSRSPRPSKYNFYVELDPSLDSASRIAVLQQKLQDLRKTYADVKAELVTIERRRKKIRRREREALKAAKQEMACT